MDLKKNGFHKIENETEKTLNLTGRTKNNDNYIIIEDNNKNIRKNKIIRNIKHINNNIIIIKFLIIINLFIQILSYNNNLIELTFSNITLRINGTGTKNIFSSRASSFPTKNYPNVVYINGNKQDTVNYSYIFNQSDNYVKLIWNNNKDYCQYLFYKCSDITEIDLRSFDTSECVSMSCMFYNCSSLTSLNLSNFNTLQVTNMMSVFWNCPSLTLLNLSNFNTLKVTNMQNMFWNCIHLEYINLQNFDESQLRTYSSMFYNVADNVVICINEDKTKILSEIRNKKCYNIDCTINWKSVQKMIIQGTSTCVDNCQNTSQYKYEYNGKCYENCSNGYILDDKNENTYKCKCELEKCLTCPKEALNKNLCTKCNNNYYKMESDLLNIGEYINCYKEIKGYYVDKNNSLFKKCYDTCETCKIKGDNITHNCLQCNTNYSFEININNYLNCYENCSYYYYFDSENYFHCTSNLSCPSNYPKLLSDKNECIKDDINIYQTSEIINEEYTSSEIESKKITSITIETVK